MANRAYLYSADQNGFVDHYWDLPGGYFDSRHSIPFAWWFFFEPIDIRIFRTGLGKQSYLNLGLVANRQDALALFELRRTSLLACIGEKLPEKYIDYFFSLVSSRPGKFLVMDPVEVLEEEPDEYAERMRNFLRMLDQPGIQPQHLQDSLNEWSPLIAGDDAEVTIIGYSYGELAEAEWDRLINKAESGGA